MSENLSENLISDEFVKQFTGSAAANGITVAVLGLLVLLKRLCDRPSKCKSHLHCPCLDVEVMDRDRTNRSKSPKTTAETSELV
jgi:hypothetical protein